MRSIFATTIALLLALSGCNGWDDDSEYESRTRAAYFLSEQSATGLNAVHKLADGALEYSWQQRFGIPDGQVGGLFSSSTSIFISDAPGGRLLEIDPATNEVLLEVGFPHRVDHFAGGLKQLLAVDTLADRYSFYNLRNGDLVTIDLQGAAGPALYNNSRFYLQAGERTISALDEYALTSRHDAQLQHPITEFQFNKFKNVIVNTRDSSAAYFVLLSGVDDRLVSVEAPVLYTKIRYSPYLEARFGKEWLEDLRLEAGKIYSGQTELQDSVSNFEADFFESVLYFQRGDTLYQQNLKTNALERRYYFDWQIRRSGYWLGRD